ncbi:MAG: hypothetical protein H6839_15480 [Planctomycetes bacterium]|nr:hypothetical protein [Planctomycetota bacterium]
MPEITKENAKEFLKHFGDLHDSTIRHVSISYCGGTPSEPTAIELEISTQEEPFSDTDWTNIKLRATGVEEFRFAEGPACLFVIFAAAIGFIEDSMYLSFDYDVDDRKGLDDLRKSQQYILCRKCSWSLSEYRDYVPTRE